MTDKGVGAWRIPKTYSMTMVIPDSEVKRVRLATKGIQKELIRRKFLAEPKKLDGIFGGATRQAVKKFQKESKLKETGEVDMATATLLFWPHILLQQVLKGIPDNLLFGVLRLESALDPGAQGVVDKTDRGIAQWNLRYHPDITDEIAYGDPIFCIEMAATALADSYESLKKLNAKNLPDHTLWDAAVAHHNNPSLARKWVREGKAPTERIAYYVELVRKSALKAPKA